MEALIPKLILDAVVAVLLGVTIFYCTKLNRRIRILQDSKSELATLIQQFDNSTQQATRSINEIHVVSKKINESIKAKLDKANYIVDDLTFMIEKGNKLADRMESDISGTRKAPEPSTRAAVRGRESVPAETQQERGRDEESARLPRRASRSGAEEDKARRNAGLENMLEKIAQKKAAAAQEPAVTTVGTARKLRASTKLRSKAEQELYDALKSEH